MPNSALSEGWDLVGIPDLLPFHKRGRFQAWFSCSRSSSKRINHEENQTPSSGSTARLSLVGFWNSESEMDSWKITQK